MNVRFPTVIPAARRPRPQRIQTKHGAAVAAAAII